MTDEQGAFVEMLAASLNAVEKADIQLGDLVVLYGPGPVGLSMLQLANARGGRTVMVGTRDYRLELAKDLGRGPRPQHGRLGLAVLHGRPRRPRSAS